MQINKVNKQANYSNVAGYILKLPYVTISLFINVDKKNGNDVNRTARVGPTNFQQEPIRIPYGSRTGPPAGLPAGIPYGSRGQKLMGPSRVYLTGPAGCTRRDPSGTRTVVFAGNNN